MRQFTAMMLDAYRELNARKLFWIVMALSSLVVLVFLIVNINDDKTLKILIWDTPIPVGAFVSQETFYKLMFTNFGVNIWLTWVATVLALVSTASIFPDFIGSGSIELVLAKPLGRLRLFLLKYISGLLFVTLQVAVFSFVSFFVIGIKGGAWEPAVFLAVPLVVCFFSYLFAFCVLIGMITRSTIPALLLTIVFWFVIFGVDATESILYQTSVVAELRVESIEKELPIRSKYLEDLKHEDPPPKESRITKLEEILSKREALVPELKESALKLQRYHRYSIYTKALLPKTSETIDLLERWLVDLADLPDLMDQNDADQGIDFSAMQATERVRIDDSELQRRVIEEHRGRSVFWILGTSLIFELLILSLAAWIFCRRDF